MLVSQEAAEKARDEVRLPVRSRRSERSERCGL